VTDQQVPEGTVAFGEIGLGGEVRTVSSIEKRITEVARLGFKRCVIPQSALRKLDRNGFGIELVGVSSVRDIGKLFK
jgi:DNA repair protein RadA/Sms